ncbi:MAG: SCO family protein [Mariprofundaceae bacterium]|nr:SCO family protein [Mariprofundaceae bacterium]
MSKKNILLVIANVLVATFLLLWWMGMQNETPSPTSSQTRSEQAVVFSLQHDQSPVTESIFTDKIGLLLVGYMHCEDGCPNLLLHMRDIFKRLNEDERAMIKAAFVNLDPTKSAAEVAKTARFFNPNILGLSGDEASLEALTKSLALDGNLQQFQAEHPHRLFLLNARGEVTASLSSKNTIDEMMTAVRAGLLEMESF